MIRAFLRGYTGRKSGLSSEYPSLYILKSGLKPGRSHGINFKFLLNFKKYPIKLKICPIQLKNPYSTGTLVNNSPTFLPAAYILKYGVKARHRPAYIL